jgi:hypothetical protein
MSEFDVFYTINGHPCHYVVEGELADPTDRRLIDDDDNLLAGRQTDSAGYEAVRPWNAEMMREIRSAATKLITDAVVESGGHSTDSPIDQYHTMVNAEQHYAVVRRLRNVLHIADQHFPLKAMDEGMSSVLNVPVTCWDSNRKFFDCSLRIIRPHQPDNNPLHRDVWLDSLRSAVNIYLPIAGSTDLTALSMITGSHYWNESDVDRTSDSGCTIDGVKFTVPAVVKSRFGLDMVRPPLEDAELLMFSPYLVHGGAKNLSQDLTRISVEMRFRRVM